MIKQHREYVDEEGRRQIVVTPSIGHPSDGYKLVLYPRNARGLDHYQYEHAHSGGRVGVDVLFRRGRYAIVRDVDPEPPGLPGAIWCIHEHYRTGLHLWARDENDVWNPIYQMDDMRAIGIDPSHEGIAAAVEEGRVSPEAIGPRFGLSQERTAREDA